MKIVTAILMVFLAIACGGIVPEKKEVTHSKKSTSPSAQEINEKIVFLKALEAKYLQENKPLNLSITRAMILELAGEIRGPASSVSHSDLKKLRKNQSFLSLELTIEHLSHREQVKQGIRHSAFHKRP